MLVFAFPWLSLVLSTVALQLLGAAWFMAVVPKPYALALGRADLGPPAPIFIVGPLVCGAVVSATNAILLGSLHVTAQADALLFGVVTGIGYLVATVFNVAINPNIPRPLLYGLVNAPYFLLGNCVSCAILTAGA